MPFLPPPPPAFVLAGPSSDPEPDGSRRVGNAQAPAATTAAPAWLRAASHTVASVDCQHYLYEVYAFDGQFLARYVMLPEGQEAYREIEQVFLFTTDPKRKPRELKPAELQFDPQAALWKGKAWLLVDRRELLKP